MRLLKVFGIVRENGESIQKGISRLVFPESGEGLSMRDRRNACTLLIRFAPADCRILCWIGFWKTICSLVAQQGSGNNARKNIPWQSS